MDYNTGNLRGGANLWKLVLLFMGSSHNLKINKPVCRGGHMILPVGDMVRETGRDGWTTTLGQQIEVGDPAEPSLLSSQETHLKSSKCVGLFLKVFSYLTSLPTISSKIGFVTAFSPGGEFCCLHLYPFLSLDPSYISLSDLCPENTADP